MRLHAGKTRRCILSNQRPLRALSMAFHLARKASHLTTGKAVGLTRAGPSKGPDRARRAEQIQLR